MTRPAAILGCPRGRAVTCGGAEGTWGRAGPGLCGAMGQCGITSSKTVLVFLNLIFWVSPTVPREGRRLRASRSEPGPESAAGLAQEPGTPLPRTSPHGFSSYLNSLCLTGVLNPFAGCGVQCWAQSLPFPRSPPPALQGGGS